MASYISWIPEALGQRFSKSDLLHGVDLNEDGSISDNEKIRDSNKNGKIGDAEDWADFVRYNQPEIVNLGGIFKWVSVFDAANPIHDLLWLESKVAPPEEVEDAYAFTENILGAVFKQNKSLMTPQEKLQSVYTLIGAYGGIPSEEVLFTKSVQKKEFDCDTANFIVMMIAHEMEWPISGVALPSHFIVRWQDPITQFNMGYDWSERIPQTDEQYASRYVVTEEAISKGVYLKNLSRNERNSYFLANVATAKGMAGQLEGAIQLFDLAISLDPINVVAHQNRGYTQFQLHRYEEAIVDYDRVLELDVPNAPTYTNRGNAKNALGLTMEAQADWEGAARLRAALPRPR